MKIDALVTKGLDSHHDNLSQDDGTWGDAAR